MRVTTAAGKVLNIHFIHSSPDCLDPNFKPRPDASPVRINLDEDAQLLERHLTLCTISSEANGEYMELGSGVAICNPLDRFSKTTGRKISLTYALDAVFPSYDADGYPLEPIVVALNHHERESVWRAYNQAIPARLTATDVLNNTDQVYRSIVTNKMTSSEFHTYIKRLLKGFNKK